MNKDPFKQFTAWVFERVFDGLDLDGGEVQDKGVELGLLELRKVNPEENEWGSDELYFPRTK